jgi:hypothetical protein
MGIRRTACLVAAIVLGTAACKGDDGNKDQAARSTTSRVRTTTTTAAADTTETSTTSTSVGATATTATGARPTTSTTVHFESNQGATVNDAPRDAHEEKTDNSGRLTYSATPVNRVTTTDRAANDPLEFTISCAVDPDGHGVCTMRMVNHVTRAAQFPGGLKILVTMVRTGGGTATFPMDLPNVSSLAAGEEAHVEGTFDLTEQGDWTYSATTTVAWP